MQIELAGNEFLKADVVMVITARLDGPGIVHVVKSRYGQTEDVPCKSRFHIEQEVNVRLLPLRTDL